MVVVVTAPARECRGFSRIVGHRTPSPLGGAVGRKNTAKRVPRHNDCARHRVACRSAPDPRPRSPRLEARPSRVEKVGKDPARWHPRRRPSRGVEATRRGKRRQTSAGRARLVDRHGVLLVPDELPGDEEAAREHPDRGPGQQRQDLHRGAHETPSGARRAAGLGGGGAHRIPTWTSFRADRSRSRCSTCPARAGTAACGSSTTARRARSSLSWTARIPQGCASRRTSSTPCSHPKTDAARPFLPCSARTTPRWSAAWSACGWTGRGLEAAQRAAVERRGLVGEALLREELAERLIGAASAENKVGERGRVTP